MNPTLLFWAHLGLLSYPRYNTLKTLYGDLEQAHHFFDRSLLQKLDCDAERIDTLLLRAKGFDADRLCERFKALQARLLFIEDPDYPAALKEIPSPPVFLFVRGILDPLHKAIAVVGTRRITAYGCFATEKIVSELVYAGCTIVSGMAIGVDACAHQQTLTDHGHTVAVLASGVDYFTPYQNQFLGEQILAGGGAIVSEYPFNTKPEPYHFPQRNRIISGLCRGTVVIEGGIHSGALITARYALDQGRDLFAVPGNLQQPGMAGCQPSYSSNQIQNL